MTLHVRNTNTRPSFPGTQLQGSADLLEDPCQQPSVPPALFICWERRGKKITATRSTIITLQEGERKMTVKEKGQTEKMRVREGLQMEATERESVSVSKGRFLLDRE